MLSENLLLQFLVVLGASSGVAAQSSWSQVPSEQWWGCDGSNASFLLPIQVFATTRAVGFNAKTLNIEDGNYDQLLSMSGASTRCNDFDINSCAMSGSSGEEALYCVYADAFTNESWESGNLPHLLFRISPGQSGTAYETCVGKLVYPYSGLTNAATFDVEGKVLYVAGSGNFIASYNIEALESDSLNQPATNDWCVDESSTNTISSIATARVANLITLPSRNPTGGPGGGTDLL